MLFILMQRSRTRKRRGIRWSHHRVESGKQGAPGLRLLPHSGNRAQGQQDQWILLMHVLVVAKRPSQAPQLGPGCMWVEVQGPMFTQLWSQRQPWGNAGWSAERASRHVLRAQTSKKEESGGIPV